MQPGTVLAGRYRAGRTLGAGGMGVIVEGTHIDLGTPVAIKVLHERLAKDPERVERFLREAKAAAQLRGEHVCRVHDVGTLPGGEPFMVMELLSGCDLSALVDQLGPLSPETVIAYAKQACAGVAEAHAVGIVHRDLKPTNIFRTTRPDGAPLIKILDFGLAKPMNGQDLSLTATSTVMGSPRYMSPEQLKSSRVTDPRSDIWALGVVMFELLVGKPPFDGDSITELALNITNDPVPPLPESVPAGLATVVLRCLEKDPAKRFQSAAELAAGLTSIGTSGAGSFADTSPDLADPLTPRPSSNPPMSLTAALDSAEVSLRPQSSPSLSASTPVLVRRRSPLWIVGAVALLAVGPAIYFTTRTSDTEPARNASGSVAAPAPTPPAPPPPAPAPTPPPSPTPTPTEAATVPIDAGVAEAPADAAEPKKKGQKKKHHTTAPATQTNPRGCKPGDLSCGRY